MGKVDEKNISNPENYDDNKNDNIKEYTWIDIDKRILGAIIIIIVDVGASLWVFDLIKNTEFFSYALYLNIVILMSFIFLLYYLLRIASDMYDRGYLKKGKLSFKVCKWIFGGLFLIPATFSVIIILLCSKVGVDQSKCAHAFYVITNQVFGNRHDLALEALEEAIYYDAGRHKEYFIERADLYFDIYEDLMREESSDVVSDGHVAYKLTYDECLNKAIADYSRVLLNETDIENVELQYKLGRIYRIKGDGYVDKAIEHLKYAYEKEPDNIDYVLEYGKALVSKNDVSYQQQGLMYICNAMKSKTKSDQSVEYYEEILMALQDIDNRDEILGDSSSYLLKNAAYSALGDTKHLQDGIQKASIVVKILSANESFVDELIVNMKDYVDREDADKTVLYEYSMALQSVDKNSEALYYIDKAIAKDPTNLRAYEQKGVILNSLRQYGDAIGIIDQMIEIYDSAENRRYKADYLYNDGKYNEAIKEYKQAMVQNDNYSAYCNYSIGQAYYRLKNYDFASSYFEKAISIGLSESHLPHCYKEWGDVCYILAKNERDNGNEEEAVALFNKSAANYHKAVDTAKTDEYKALCYNWAGNAHACVADYNGAVYDYRMAIQLDSSEPAYRDNLVTYTTM